MSGQVLRFTSTKITAGTSAAAPKPDKDGYYCNLIFGAFDVTTPSRQNFPFAPVEKLLCKGSPLHRRATNGALKGEWGHPKQMPGESKADYISRISMVNEEKVAIHIRDFRLVPAKDKQGNSYIQVRGDVKPSGPYGKYFEESMANPHENIGLSIRGLSRDTWKGTVMQSVFTHIFNWDVVIEPGIAEANKFDSVNMQQLDCFEVPVSELLDSGQMTGVGVTLLNAGIDVRGLIRDSAVTQGAPVDSRSW